MLTRIFCHELLHEEEKRQQLVQKTSHAALISACRHPAAIQFLPLDALLAQHIVFPQPPPIRIAPSLRMRSAFRPNRFGLPQHSGHPLLHAPIFILRINFVRTALS